jgi:hypothetical protein
MRNFGQKPCLATVYKLRINRVQLADLYAGPLKILFRTSSCTHSYLGFSQSFPTTIYRHFSPLFTVLYSVSTIPISTTNNLFNYLLLMPYVNGGTV